VVRLEGTLLGNAQILALVIAQLGQLDVESAQMGGGHLLIQSLGEHVHTNRVLPGVGPQVNLGKHLVGEGARHDERGMTHGTTQVDQATLSQEDDILAILQGESIHLGLDVSLLDGVVLQPLHVNFTVKVADVAHDGIILHLQEMLADDDVLASSGGDKDAASADRVLQRGHLVAFHGRLESIDGIHLSDDDTAAEAAQALGAALAHVTVASHASHLQETVSLMPEVERFIPDLNYLGKRLVIYMGVLWLIWASQR
jgi:hypothetical protein